MRPIHVLLLATALSVSAQQAPVVESQVFVTAVDVVADVRDKAGITPQGLTPADFVLTEDGVERRVIGVQYLGKNQAPADVASGADAAPAAATARPRWEVVLYFETQLSSGQTRRRVAEELIQQADALVALGKVDVVIADPSPKALLRGSSDPEAIRQALRTVITHAGQNRLAFNRRQFLQEMRNLGGMAGLRSQEKNTNETTGTPSRIQMDLPSNTGNPKAPPSTNVSAFDESPNAVARVNMNTIRPYVAQEIQLVGGFRKNLLAWLGSYGRHTPRTLIMVTDGFDVDPLEFYRGSVSDRAALRTFSEESKMDDSVNSLAQTLSAAGWMTVSIPGDSNADLGWVDDSSVSGVLRIHEATSTVQSASTSRNRIVFQPLQPLQTFADATGGAVVPNSGKIAAAIDSIGDRLLVTYQVDRKPDGKPRKVQLRTRDAALKVRSVQWSSSATPDQIAQTRAIGLIEIPSTTGDFPVEATVEWNPPGAKKSGIIRVSAPLESIRRFLPTTGKANFRITMAIHVPPNNAFAVNSVLPNYDLADGTFRFRAPIDVPASASTIVLVIEEISSGLWGTARVAVP